ncbi:hypothetical protein NPIL_119151 [Nephila pilipes]|uniref:Uncharacterized protein n=1 Tax=Nephila pilipes TaxID=299642 RepID=A0A8X6U1M0_NEPPI|nr:hypothetical protein NPIL_119151 [Nephila pilipes]
MPQRLQYKRVWKGKLKEPLHFFHIRWVEPPSDYCSKAPNDTQFALFDKWYAAHFCRKKLRVWRWLPLRTTRPNRVLSQMGWVWGLLWDRELKADGFVLYSSQGFQWAPGDHSMRPRPTISVSLESRLLSPRRGRGHFESIGPMRSQSPILRPGCRPRGPLVGVRTGLSGEALFMRSHLRVTRPPLLWSKSRARFHIPLVLSLWNHGSDHLQLTDG